MSEPQRAQLEDYLLALGGTYLRNVLRSEGACTQCGGGCSEGFTSCYVCGGLPPSVMPDASGFLSYAADGTTAGTLMYGYKAPMATLEQKSVIKLLAYRGFGHVHCAERPVGAKITHCATVPSTRRRDGTHPLEQMVEPFLPWRIHPVHHQANVSPVRQHVQNDLFATNPLPPSSHVLVIEDTWTSGNRALSAVAAIRTAGAEHVTLLCLSRWLSFDFIAQHQQNPSRLYARLRHQRVYQLDVCPFTGTACPDDHGGST